MSSAKSEASSVLTDLGKYTKRRYYELDLPDGSRFRIRSLSRVEQRTGTAHVEGERIKDAIIALALVDAQGDTILPNSEEGYAELDGIDLQVWTSLWVAVEAFVLTTVDYEEVAKNYEATRNA